MDSLPLPPPALQKQSLPFLPTGLALRRRSRASPPPSSCSFPSLSLVSSPFLPHSCARHTDGKKTGPAHELLSIRSHNSTPHPLRSSSVSSLLLWLFAVSPLLPCSLVPSRLLCPFLRVARLVFGSFIPSFSRPLSRLSRLCASASREREVGWRAEKMRSLPCVVPNARTVPGTQ